MSTEPKPIVPATIRWQAELDSDAGVTFRIGRTDDELVAEWVGKATLVARRDGSGSRLAFEPDLDPQMRTKIEQGSAWLLLRALGGGVALHGAAVCHGGRAVLLLGRSGHGKSTLAAAACREGAVLLADDAVALEQDGGEGFLVLPREAHHWLDSASCSALGLAAPSGGKHPLPARRTTSDPAALVGIIDLRFGDVSAPRLRRQHGLEAASALVPQVVRFILDEDARKRHELDVIHQLVSAVPCYILERPRALELLPQAAREVLAILSPA